MKYMIKDYKKSTSSQFPQLSSQIFKMSVFFCVGYSQNIVLNHQSIHRYVACYDYDYFLAKTETAFSH